MAKSTAVAKSPEDRYRQWHRLFGLLLTDYLSDSPFTVEIESDLSKRVQRLDVVVVRRRPGELARPLPDGLNDFVAHNLISFKSFQEPLDDWALKELTGHYVNYRKQVSPKDSLLPEAEFALYAVCARHPRNLFHLVGPEKLQDGVYLVRRGTDVIRIVVVRDLPKTEQNALLHLFSAAPAQVQYGVEHYQLQKQETSSIVGDLFREYEHEGLAMPYTMSDYVKDKVRENLHKLTVEERLAGLSKEQIESYLKRIEQGRPETAKRPPKKRR